MKTITDEQAQSDLPQLLEQVAASHEPVQINGKRASAISVAEEDWRSIEETLYLLSVPGMRESIREGMGTPLEQCASWHIR
jgi:antitoxin YefM